MVNFDVQLPFSVDMNVSPPPSLYFSVEGSSIPITPPYEGEYTISPLETDVIIPISGFKASQDIVVEAIPSTYVGSNIPQRNETDLTASGATVTVPNGYYADTKTKTVASGSASTPATTITANPSISISSGGLITATNSKTQNITPSVTPGYVSTGSAGTVTVSGSNTSQLSTQAAATIAPTESEQTAVTAGKYTTGVVKVGAISSTYVGSGVTQRSSSDLSASGATVTAPAGYYASNATKTVTSGTAGTPTAAKGAVSNHSVSVTPSVTNTTGYITGSTKTGTAVTVSASELVSGSETKTANGTYDVTNLAELVVNVSGGGGGIGTLLNTSSMGTQSTSSTTAADTGVSLSVSGVNNYDLLIVETSVDSVTNNRHTATVGLIFLTAGTTVGTKNGATIATVKWNSKISSSAVTSTRAGTTAYGIYPNSCTVATSNDVTTATIPMYRRYNSTSTGTINGTYTARVYGINLYDLIGG